MWKFENRGLHVAVSLAVPNFMRSRKHLTCRFFGGYYLSAAVPRLLNLMEKRAFRIACPSLLKYHSTHVTPLLAQLISLFQLSEAD